MIATAPRHRTHRPRAGWPRLLAIASLAAALLAGCAKKPPEHTELTDITGYFPGLKLQLATADGKPLTAAGLRGQVVILYFGYTNCPDVCPMTLGVLSSAVRALGPDASAVSIVFVSVDPRRDTPAKVANYARAFSPRGIGVTGTPDQIEQLAKLYRVAYEADQPDANGNYAVMHSKAVYIFDRRGRARLLADDKSAAAMITHDLQVLIDEPDPKP